MTLKKIIPLITIALNGAFIGSMVLIAFVFVPYWKSSEPQVFLDWFTIYGPKIGNLMIPLGPGVLALAILSLILDKKNKWLWILTIVFTLANILYFPFYFLPTNTSFAEHTIPITDISNELSNWLNYHWQRVFFAFGALITSILAMIKK